MAEDTEMLINKRESYSSLIQSLIKKTPTEYCKEQNEVANMKFQSDRNVKKSLYFDV